MHRITRLQSHERALALYMLYFFSMWVATLGGLAVALPAVMEDFDVDVSIAAWFLVAYSLGLAAGTFPFARISTLIDRKTLILAGIFIDVALMVWIFFVTDIYILLVLRFLHAIARVPPWLNLQVMGIEGFPPERRGRAVGLTMAATGLGILVALPFTGFVVDTIGWRWLFMGTAGWFAVIGIMVWVFLPKDPPRWDREPVHLSSFDIPGTAFMMIGVICVLSSLQLFTKGTSLEITVPLGLVGAGALGAFVWTELRTKTPVVMLSLFRIPGVLIGATQAVLVGFATGSILIVLPFLFKSGYGWSIFLTGNVLLFMNLARPFSGPAAGWLTDKVGTPKVMLPATLLAAIGLGALYSLDAGPSYYAVAAVLFVSGTGLAFMQTANLRQLFVSLPRVHLNMAPSTNLVMVMFGTTAGQALTAAALDRIGVGKAGSDPASIVSGATTILLWTGVGIMAGMVLAQIVPRLALRRVPQPEFDAEDVAAG